jgi:hypothetical protein
MLRELLEKQNYTEIDLQQTAIGHFQIEAFIDGIAAHFIIDTGAASTVIDLEFAQINNMAIEDTGEQGGGVGNSKMDFYRLQPKLLLISSLSLQDPVIYAMDFQHVKDALISKGIDNPAQGVIGADILIPHKAIIDYANKKLYLKKEGDDEDYNFQEK